MYKDVLIEYIADINHISISAAKELLSRVRDNILSETLEEADRIIQETLHIESEYSYEILCDIV